MIYRVLGSILLLMVSVFLLPFASNAAPLETPTGKVFFTVSGNITHTNAGEKAKLDREMLEAPGSTSCSGYRCNIRVALDS